MTSSNKKGQAQKWSLFFALVLALGFNLSMDPRHFNNVVRVEKEDTIELASRSKRPAKPKEESEDTDSEAGTVVAPEEKVEASATYNARSGKTQLRVQVEDRGNRVVAKFEKTEGESCFGLCDSTKVLQGLDSIDVVSDVQAAIKRLVDDAKDRRETPDADESSTQNYSFNKWTRGCFSMTADGKFNCLVNGLVQMSKEIKNDETHDDQVLAFFNEYISSDLQQGLKLPRPRMRYSSYEMFQDDMMTFEEASERYEEYKELALKMTEELRTKNGKSVRKEIAKMMSRSYQANSNIARNIVREGKRRSDELDPNGLFMMNRGRMFLQQMQSNALIDQMNFDASINGIENATTGEIDYFSGVYNRYFYEPTNNYFESMLGTAQKPVSYEESLRRIMGNSMMALANAQADVDSLPASSEMTREALARRGRTQMVRRSADLTMIPIIPSPRSIPGTSYNPYNSWPNNSAPNTFYTVPGTNTQAPASRTGLLSPSARGGGLN